MGDPRGSFACCRCSKNFRMVPGAHVCCPDCEHLYCKWLDYARFVRRTS